MADRVRDIAKRSSSKLHISKSSVNHIGATPYRFRIDLFISHVDNLTPTPTDLCVTCERRGNIEATPVVKVKDSKAVFRHTLSLQSTLFRRATKPTTASTDANHLKFDEKKAKLVLRKGASDGKPLGKIALNLAEYVRGTTSTVFADIKLSNDAVVVTKIEATMLHVGKKKKNTSQTGSEACSEMTEMSGMDNDSIFGDDDRDLGDLEIPATSTPDGLHMDVRSGAKKQSLMGVRKQDDTSGLMSPVSSAASSSTQSLTAKAHPGGGEMKHDALQNGSKSSSMLSKLSSKGGTSRIKKEEELKESPSLKDKLKSKMKKKDKDREEGLNKSSSTRTRKKDHLREQAGEMEALKKEVESVRKENEKLKKSKQAAMEEIEALRADLVACEEALEEANNADGEGGGQATLELSKTLKEKDRKIAELQAQTESLLEELEEMHEGAVDSAVGVAAGQMNQLKQRIEELETALKREPQYMDVVNELKVTKVSLALANMEKEQALFALQTANQQYKQEQ